MVEKFQELGVEDRQINRAQVDLVTRSAMAPLETAMERLGLADSLPDTPLRALAAAAPFSLEIINSLPDSRNDPTVGGAAPFVQNIPEVETVEDTGFNSDGSRANT